MFELLVGSWPALVEISLWRTEKQKSTFSSQMRQNSKPQLLPCWDWYFKIKLYFLIAAHSYLISHVQ